MKDYVSILPSAEGFGSAVRAALEMTVACPACAEPMRATSERTPTGIAITVNEDDARKHGQMCFPCECCTRRC